MKRRRSQSTSGRAYELSGEFDPGLIAQLKASVDLKELGRKFSSIPTSVNAIVLFVRNGDSYAVASDPLRLHAPAIIPRFALLRISLTQRFPIRSRGFRTLARRKGIQRRVVSPPGKARMSDRAKCVILVPANYGIEPEV